MNEMKENGRGSNTESGTIKKGIQATPNPGLC